MRSDGGSVQENLLRRRRAHAHNQRLRDVLKERAADEHDQRVSHGRELSHPSGLLLEMLDRWAHRTLVSDKRRGIVGVTGQLPRQDIRAEYGLAACAGYTLHPDAVSVWM